MSNCENLATKQDVQELKQAIDGLLQQILLIMGAISAIQSICDNILNTVKEAMNLLTDILSALANLPATIINGIFGLLNTLLEGLLNALGNKDNEILDLLKWLQQRIDMIRHEVEAIRSLLDYLGDIIKSIYQLAYDTKQIAEFLANLLDKLYQEWAETYYQLSTQIENLRQELAKALTKLAQDLEKALQDIYDDLVSRLEKLASNIKDWIDNAFDKIEDALEKLKDYIEGIYKWLEARVNEILDAIGKLKNPEIDLAPVFARLEQLSGELANAKIDISSVIGGVGQTIIATAEERFGTTYNLLGEAHEKLNLILAKEGSPLIPRIYHLLGGGAYFDSEGGFKGLSLNPFFRLKEKYNELETTDGEGKIEEGLTLPEYIQNLVAATYGRLGLQDFPIAAPENIADQENATVSIPHLTRFQSWQTKQIDALLGQYPIEIDIEDSDLVKTGNQKLEVRLPNVAETLAEIVGLLITTRGLADASVNIGVRTLSELGVTRETVTKGYYKTEAIEDYLGYELKRKTIVVPHFFNPHGEEAGDPVEKLENFLQFGKTDLEIEEYVEDRGLEFKLTTLLEAARIIKSHLWRPVKLDEDSFAAQMKRLLRRGEQATNKVDESLNKEDDFDAYLEQVERGFIDKSGIKDAEKPYGRPYDQRPKITEIGTQAPNDGGEVNP